MIPEFGHYALILALVLAFVQTVAPLISKAEKNFSVIQLSRCTSLGQFIFVSISFFSLGYAFLANDFSVAYVAENSNTHLPIIYRFCAIWGAHEGSLLLWVFILTIWTMAVSIFSRSLPQEMLVNVLAVMAMIAIGFYLFLLFTSDPFQRLLPYFPLQGQNLNPILQDPGLVIHPPMLYMGYVGFSVVFAFAIAALLKGQLNSEWARWARSWTLFAWCFLTFGIVLGSWWSYRELGWGGFWFWDPVENASFLPWLAGTALIHCLAVTEKRNAFKTWVVLLAVCTFSLSLLGTFLVRSGVLISVHAFANDPKRGLFLLRFLMIVIGLSMLLYAWRAKFLVSDIKIKLLSRETILLSNNVILFAAMLTVLLGTLYPLIINALNLGKISVGAPYFNTVFIPISIPMMFLMGLAPWFHWYGRDSLSPFSKKLFMLFILIACLTGLSLWATTSIINFKVFVLLMLAVWVIVSTVKHTRSLRKVNLNQLAMLFAHLGLAITVIGLVLTTAYTQQRNLSMRAGDVANVGPYQFKFEGVSSFTGPDYDAIRATLVVSDHRRFIAKLYPELRDFSTSQETIAKSAIDASLFRDLYVALSSSLGEGAWAIRIYYKPFVRWIWGGGLLMILGGLCALWSKRLLMS